MAAAQRLQGQPAQDFLGAIGIVGRKNKAPMAASHQKREQKVFVLGPGRAANQQGLVVCKGMPVEQGAISPCNARGGRVKAPVAQQQGGQASGQRQFHSRGLLQAYKGCLAQKRSIE